MDRGLGMSEPIPSSPKIPISRSIDRPADQGEQLTKADQVALAVLRSFGPPPRPLTPVRVKSADLEPFEWCWGFREETTGTLKWDTLKGVSDSDIDTLNREQFPLVQPTYPFLQEVFVDRFFRKEEDGLKNNAFLKIMGFVFKARDKKFFTPTREQLVINYNTYQKQHPHFPELVFEKVDGALKPDEFVQNVLDSDLILSSNQELIHDFVFHCIPTLSNIYESPRSYRFYKDNLKQAVEAFLSFLNKKPIEILAELNNKLNPKIDESLIKDIVATLKYMVGAALDELTAEILDYTEIEGQKDAQGYISEKFIESLLRTLNDEMWKEALSKALPTLNEEFFENYPNQDRWKSIVTALLSAQGKFAG